MDVRPKIVPENIEPRRSCKGCGRVVVCQIFRVEQEYLQKEFIDKKIEPPFAADSLAAICKYFLPLSMIRLPTNTTENTDEK